MPIESQSDKYASIVREMIRHENDLVNHRLTWLCQVQGLLFAALGVTLTNDFSDEIAIRPILIFIGIAVSISSAIGLKSANYAINELKTDFIERYPNYSGPNIIGFDASNKINVVFRWNKIKSQDLGEDNERLIDFLKTKLDRNLLRHTIIKKVDDDTVCISSKFGFPPTISLSLDRTMKKKEVILKIGEKYIGKFIAKTEDHDINIYDKVNGFFWRFYDSLHPWKILPLLFILVWISILIIALINVVDLWPNLYRGYFIIIFK